MHGQLLAYAQANKTDLPGIINLALNFATTDDCGKLEYFAPDEEPGQEVSPEALRAAFAECRTQQSQVIYRGKTIPVLQLYKTDDATKIVRACQDKAGRLYIERRVAAKTWDAALEAVWEKNKGKLGGGWDQSNAAIQAERGWKLTVQRVSLATLLQWFATEGLEGWPIAGLVKAGVTGLTIPAALREYAAHHEVDPVQVAQHLLDSHGKECAEKLKGLAPTAAKRQPSTNDVKPDVKPRAVTPYAKAPATISGLNAAKAGKEAR